MTKNPIFRDLENQLFSRQGEFDHPRYLPSEPIRWPSLSSVSTQVQQIKTASKPAGLTNTQQGSRPVSTVNMPKHVSKIAVSSVDLGNGQALMTVAFHHNPADPNFSKANIHVKTLSGVNQVVSTTSSPASFILDKSQASSGAIVVQTEGNWGPNPIESSPSRAFSLQRSTGASPVAPTTVPVSQSGGGTVTLTGNVLFEVNGAPTTSQTEINYKSGTDIAVTNPSLGIVKFDFNGVLAHTLVNASHKWLNSYDATTGLFTQTQPAYSDISGTPQLAQTKALISHQFLTSYDASTGLFTAAQPAYSDISGTPQLAVTKTLVSHQFFTSYDSTTGLFTAAQPAFTDISGSIVIGQTPLTTAGDLLFANSSPALDRLGVGASPDGYVLTLSGGLPVWAAGGGGGGFTNPMTTLGDLIYENATPTAARLAGNTTSTKMYLSSTGIAGVAQAPVWAQIAYADLSGTPQLAVTIANASHKWLNSYDSTTGLFTQTQPAFTDISSLLAIAQISATGTPSSSTFLRGDGAWAAASGGSVPSLSTVAVTTGTLAVNAIENDTLTMFKQVAIQTIAVSSAARVRLYQTSAARTADATRSNSVPPTPGYPTQIIGDWYLDGSSLGPLTFPCTPIALGQNGDGPQSPNIYCAITNIGTGSAAITATITFVQQES